MGHTRFSKYFDKQLEKKVLENGDQIITVSNGCQTSFLSKSKKINADKFIIIPNGYDPEDFDFSKNAKKNKDKNLFTVAYTGTISDQYEPIIFFEALEKIAKENTDLTIQFQHIGSLSPKIQHYLNSLENIKFDFIPTVPHNEVVEYQKNAHLLFLAIPKVAHSKGILTGKLFEYLGSRNKIIAIGPEDGDVAEILEQCNAGKIYNRKNESSILAFLKTQILNFRNNTPPNNNEQAIQTFSRESQAQAVKKLI